MILLAILFGIKLHDKRIQEHLPYLIRTGQFNEIECRISIGKQFYFKEHKEAVTNSGVIKVMNIIYILTIPVYIYFILDGRFPKDNIRLIIIGLLGFISSLVFFFLSGILLNNYIFIKKWEKEHNKKAYTNFNDLLLVQKEININRKRKNLKKLNIKKLFLGKKFYKKMNNYLS